MSKNKQLVVICLLTLMVIQPSAPGISFAAPGPRLRLEPADLVVDLNETFTVQVVIEEARNLGGFEFELVYDPSILQVKEAALGDFLESTGRSAVPAGPEVNNEEGRVTFGAVNFGDGPGPEGTGVLAAITCIAQGGGSTALKLEEVQVLDTEARVQQVAVESGRVVVRGEAAATPAATATPASPAEDAPSWALPLGLLAALGLAILAALILRRKPQS